MGANFNGTTSRATYAGAAGGIVTAYPFTMFCWVRATAGYGTGATALLEALAADTGLGANAVIGGIITAANSRAYATQIGGGSINAFGAAPTAGTWQSMMVCHVSASLRKIYFGGNAPVQDTAAYAAGTLSGYKAVSIGYRNIASDLPVKADLACVGIWNMELTGTDYTALNGGAVPSTVQAANLVEYWSLLNAASLTGVNGRVLTGTALTDSIVISGSPVHPIVESGPASDLSGNVNLDAVVAAGALGSATSDLSGGVSLDAVVAAGSMGSTIGTCIVPELRNWGGSLQAGVTLAWVTFLRVTDAVQVLAVATRTTNGATGDLVVSDAALAPGTWYMAVGWNSDGSMRFAVAVQAA